MTDTRKWKLLHSADDVTDEIMRHVAETVEWFANEPRIATDDFIDQLCKCGGDGYGPDDWDIDRLDTPAVKKIMREARSIHRDMIA